MRKGRKPKRVLNSTHLKSLPISWTFFLSKAKAFNCWGRSRKCSQPKVSHRGTASGRGWKGSLPLGRVEATAPVSCTPSLALRKPQQPTAVPGAGHPPTSNPRQGYTPCGSRSKSHRSLEDKQENLLRSGSCTDTTQRSATTKRGAGHSPTQDSLQQTAATGGRSRNPEKAPPMGLPESEAGPGVGRTLLPPSRTSTSHKQ